MSLIKSCNQVFMTCIYYHKLFKSEVISGNKTQGTWHFLYKLANSVDTKWRPFHVKLIALSRIERLQQLHQVHLLNLFVCNMEKLLLFGLFLPRKIITILRKIVLHFTQMSLKGVLLSVNVLECFGKIF